MPLHIENLHAFASNFIENDSASNSEEEDFRISHTKKQKTIVRYSESLCIFALRYYKYRHKKI